MLPLSLFQKWNSPKVRGVLSIGALLLSQGLASGQEVTSPNSGEVIVSETIVSTSESTPAGAETIISERVISDVTVQPDQAVTVAEAKPVSQPVTVEVAKPEAPQPASAAGNQDKKSEKDRDRKAPRHRSGGKNRRDRHEMSSRESGRHGMPFGRGRDQASSSLRRGAHLSSGHHGGPRFHGPQMPHHRTHFQASGHRPGRQFGPHRFSFSSRRPAGPSGRFAGFDHHPSSRQRGFGPPHHGDFHRSGFGPKEHHSADRHFSHSDRGSSHHGFAGGPQFGRHSFGPPHRGFQHPNFDRHRSAGHGDDRSDDRHSSHRPNQMAQGPGPRSHFMGRPSDRGFHRPDRDHHSEDRMPPREDNRHGDEHRPGNEGHRDDGPGPGRPHGPPQGERPSDDRPHHAPERP
jgi:hypothetical protein